MEVEILYLDLLKKVLTGLNRIDRPIYIPTNWGCDKTEILDQEIISLSRGAEQKGLNLCKKTVENPDHRLLGGDLPYEAETMIGMKRLENIEFCINEIIKNKVPGDFIETGVWRGGATIFMRAMLKVMGINNRTVWVADSFEGLPKPDPKSEADRADRHHLFGELAVSMEEVQNNFLKYNLLDEQVKFLNGWFKDTLPIVPIENLALLRLDCDMYGSTMDALIHLYPKLSRGGFVIIDDWGAVPACKQAVLDFRSKNNIYENIHVVDWTGIYWQKK